MNIEIVMVFDVTVISIDISVKKDSMMTRMFWMSFVMIHISMKRNGKQADKSASAASRQRRQARQAKVGKGF